MRILLGGEIMFKLKVVLCFFTVCIVFLCACTSEPMLPSEVIENVTLMNGYILAPTYLPKGFEYIPVSDSVIPIIETDNSTIIKLAFRKTDLEKGTAEIFMMFPYYEGKYSPFEERLGLIVPEEAVSEIIINRTTAYLFQGNWSDDTLHRLVQAEVLLNPEWDYNSNISIRFAVDVPDYGQIWVLLTTIIPTDIVGGDDLIKIARSVVVIQ